MNGKRLSGKVALITGASRGIGKAIAIEFAKEGVSGIILNYAHNDTKAKETKEILESLNVKVLPIKADISRRENIKLMISKGIESFGKIDILVSNAAISQEKPFNKITDEDWENMLKVNLQAPFMLIQDVLPQFLKNKFGRIINIASIGGQWGGFNQVHYAASKAGLISLTHSIAKIYSKFGVTCNAVSPGLVATDMSSNELQTEAGKKKLKNIPVGRIAKPEEVAKVVAFLASEEASYITGQTINVNGGMLFSHGV